MLRVTKKLLVLFFVDSIKKNTLKIKLKSTLLQRFIKNVC